MELRNGTALVRAFCRPWSFTTPDRALDAIQWDGPETQELLLRVLDRSPGAVRALSPWDRLLLHVFPARRRLALLAVGGWKVPNALPVLLHELRNGDAWGAIAALKALEDREAIPALLDTITHGAHELATAAGSVAAKISGPNDSVALCSALTLLPPLSLLTALLLPDRKQRGRSATAAQAARELARRELASTLGRLRDPRSVRTLLSCPIPQFDLGTVLARFGPPAVPPLISALQSPDGMDVPAALEALFSMGEAAVLPLRAAFQRAAPNQRYLFAVALAGLGDSDECWIPSLVEGLEHVPLQAATALGRLAERNSTPALRSALPGLKRWEAKWTSSKSTREACYQAIILIEGRTDNVRSVPLPATAPESSPQLPRPAQPADPAAAQLPVIR